MSTVSDLIALQSAKKSPTSHNLLSCNALESGAIIMPHQIIWSWYTGRWWIGSYIWYSENGTGRGPSPPLLAVPNVIATHQRPVYQSPYCCIMVRCLAVLIYTSLFHQRNGSSKNTYNIINKENTISKHKVNMTISIVKNVTIKLQSILEWFTSTHKFFIFPEIL